MRRSAAVGTVLGACCAATAFWLLTGGSKKPLMVSGSVCSSCGDWGKEKGGRKNALCLCTASLRHAGFEKGKKGVKKWLVF